MYVHLTLVPYIGPSEEMKTKPTQHSVAELRSRGIQPDAIVVRSERPIDDAIRRKISLFCDVAPEAVIACPDAHDIYEVPLVLHEQGFDQAIVDALQLDAHEPDLSDWIQMVERATSVTDSGDDWGGRQVRGSSRCLPVGL